MWTEDVKVFKELTHKHYEDVDAIIEKVERVYQFYLSVASDKREKELKDRLKKILNELYDVLNLLKTDEKIDLNRYIIG